VTLRVRNVGSRYHHDHFPEMPTQQADHKIGQLSIAFEMLSPCVAGKGLIVGSSNLIEICQRPEGCDLTVTVNSGDFCYYNHKSPIRHLTTYSHSEISIELTHLCQRFFQWLVGSKSQRACSVRRRCIITSAGSVKVGSR